MEGNFSVSNAYPALSLITFKPVLIGTAVQPGQTAGGWVSFIVEQKEDQLCCMVFSIYGFFFINGLSNK
jgi:hypothetical protein